MKRFTIIMFILPVVFSLASCYGVEKEDYKALAGIEIDIEDGAYINAPLLEPLLLDIGIRSENDKEMTYEWAFGAISDKGFPFMADTTFVSDKKNVDYAFSRIGEFILRLRVDNGETIVFRYYRLRVLSGVDEGIVLLSNDDQGNGYLSYIKTRVTDDIKYGDREYWLDIMAEMNPDYRMKHANDMFLSYSAFHNSASLIITLSDDDGSLIKMDPRTFLVTVRKRMEDVAPGVKPLKIVGEILFASDMLDRYAAYVMGSDGNIYRYDLQGDELAVRADYMGYDFTKAYEFRQDFMIFPRRFFYFRSGNFIISPYISGIVYQADFEGYEVINIGATREYTVIVIIARNLDDGKIYHIPMVSDLSYSYDGIIYEEPDLCIDENSIVLTSRSMQMALYNYNDRIYAWDVYDYENARLPTSPVTLQPPLPAGEQIVTLGLNGDPKDMEAAENHLYVATYNPSRAGDTKGSLYIYEIPGFTLVKSYEGMFHKPVKVFYKYPVSL